MALTEIPIELSSTPSIVDGGNATAITIDSSEKVLIGTGTSGSTDLLQVESPASGGGHGIQIRRNDNNTDQQVGRIMMGNVVDSDLGQIAVKTDGANNSGAILFSTASAGTTAERLRIDASGRVTMPLQPAFLAVAATQNNIPINANTTVNFTSQVFDQGSNYAGTSFTAPVTGKYQLNLSLYVLEMDSAADYVQIAIVTSNRQYYAIVDPGVWTGDPTYWSFAITVLADMDVSDTAHVEVQLNNSGAAQMDITANSAFSGYLVA